MSASAQQNTQQIQITDYQDLSKSTLQYQNDLNKMHNELHPENASKIARQIAAMNRELANAHIQDAITGVRDSAKHYQTAVQLQKTGEHVGNVQKQLLDRNKKILANLSADTMTAKRVATINQQHSIQARVATQYVQLCSIFFGIAILSMFLFSLGPVRSFFKHPFAAMQIALSVLLATLVILILYRVITNRNHYQMLYQERVFPNYNTNIDTSNKSECPVVEDDASPPPIAPDNTDDAPTCPPVEVYDDEDNDDEDDFDEDMD